MANIWLWFVDGMRQALWNIIGATSSLIGTCIITVLSKAG
ncbi:hypothetical protein C1E23_16720 [Pseudoalteromonas phenolica]|uniref:Uncharacterized protein n=1 Tax=Pseudoalteromonas phenolica TaxID=161398 RepID=A0A4Q7ILR1_9GAMM|nr:hypothetical protein C1E23_16720 [Pseudoalteromonas phenolica]